jgi:DNA-binding response OmpR family regulator
MFGRARAGDAIGDGCEMVRATSATETVPSPHASTIEAGDLRIDLLARTVMLRGRELRLNSEEFDLLVFLTSHPKRMVTPATLLSTNWPGQGARQTEFLPALLSLRKKLDAQGFHCLRIEPWVIYRFDPTL